MRILVLGGAGYIGSHTVYELVDAGYEVIVVDNLLTGFKEAVHPQAKFYEGDIRDKIFLDNILSKEKIDGVIHFAASSQVGESMKNPLKYYNNNLCGTEVLLESMVEHGIDKIVFSSTAATYGEPESIPILETDRTLPTNCYGETKLSMEKMFKWTSKAYNLRYVSLRYFNACGAHPNGKIGEAHNPETHLIPLVLQVPNGKREYISVFGNDYDTKDGTCVRDYIHVNDLAQAHILAMEYLSKGGESNIFNGVMTGHKKVSFCQTEFDCVDDIKEGLRVQAVIRPEDVVLTEAGKGKLQGEVLSSIFKGTFHEITVLHNEKDEIVAQASGDIAKGTKVGVDILPDSIHLMHFNEKANHFTGMIDDAMRIRLVDGSIKVDMTKLFPGSTLQDGVLYDKSGHPIETEGRKVVVYINPRQAQLSDDPQVGLVQGHIDSLIYMGDHYSYEVRSSNDELYFVYDEYLWNIGDYVSVVVPDTGISVTLAE